MFAFEMERASKNLLFATTIVLFYPLEMVRQKASWMKNMDKKVVFNLVMFEVICVL